MCSCDSQKVNLCISLPSVLGFKKLYLSLCSCLSPILLAATPSQMWHQPCWHRFLAGSVTTTIDLTVGQLDMEKWFNKNGFSNKQYLWLICFLPRTMSATQGLATTSRPTRATPSTSTRSSTSTSSALRFPSSSLSGSLCHLWPRLVST